MFYDGIAIGVGWNSRNGGGGGGDCRDGFEPRLYGRPQIILRPFIVNYNNPMNMMGHNYKRIQSHILIMIG